MVVISTSSESSYIWVQQPQMFSAGYKQAALNWLGEWWEEWQEGERLLRILRQKYLGSNEQQLLLPHYSQHFSVGEKNGKITELAAGKS